MSLDNLLWGAARIHGELLKLGFEAAQSTVAKYMAKRRWPRSQSWKIFLRNHAEGIAAIDKFVVLTVDLRMLFALVIVGIDRRLLFTINVTAHPTAEWIARQVTEAFPWDRAPKYLIVIATVRTARLLSGAFMQWGYVTGRLPLDPLGRMRLPNG